MSGKRGWIKLYRQIWDNPIWQMETKFDERSAWIDLLLMANHENRTIVCGRSVIPINRGQLFTSARKLGARWGWPLGTVKRYLDMLSDLEMVSRCGTAHGTLLTIVNYDDFQGERPTLDTTDGTPAEREGNASGTRAGDKQELLRTNNNVGEAKTFMPGGEGQGDSIRRIYE